jgi:hypothetical protein
MQPRTMPSTGSATGKLIPPPSARLPLATVKQVRLELARLYRETKAGHIDPADAAKLAFILDRLRQCIVDHEIEARVMLLEQLTEERKS